MHSENETAGAEQVSQETLEAFYHEVPTFIYSYDYNTDQLYRTSLVTGGHSVPSYMFNACCYWSEVPGGSLLFTGGASAVLEVVRIDNRREFAVAHCAPMLTSRRDHTAVYHTPHLCTLEGSLATSKD
jgi:hypothetical protein